METVPEIIVRETKSAKDLKEFIKFPMSLYKGHPLWVPPLVADEMLTLNKKLNPAAKHSDFACFIAYKDGKIAGRIAAIINRKANKDWNDNTVRFGWIDFIDDYNVSEALINTVAEWGKKRGMTKLRGPLGFSDMDKEGLLIEGFDNEPSITTIYNFPYYSEHLERLGLSKDVDWIQRFFYLPENVPEKLESFSKIVEERYGVRVFRPKNKKELKKRGRELFYVLNDAFVPLYEFTRLSEEQIRMYVNQYIPFVNPDLVCAVIDSNDRIIGFAITMPTLSKAMRKAKGKLLPFGFYHLLRALKKMDYLEMYLIGVIPEYQNKGINALIFNYLHKNGLKHGIKKVVSNPQLENNKAVQALFDYYPMQPYQKRRCYIKEI